MNLPTWLSWLTDVVDVVQAHAQHVAIGAGAIGMLIAAYVIRRAVKGIKRREHDELAANLGVILFLIVTTEGMWEVVHGRMGVPLLLTVAMFAAYDVVIYSQGAAAVRALAADATARIGSYLLIIWAMSAAASVTVGFASGNAATWFFRFFSPLVAASLWTQKLLARRARNRVRQESNWIWTPDRLMVRWGWKKPGVVDDLTDTFASRRIAALVDAGLTLHAEQQAAQLRQGEPAAPSRWWRMRQRDPLAEARRRMQRLTKTASAEDVTAARVQLRRVLTIEAELFRDDSQPTQRERALMDELRLVMRQATTTVRDELRAEGRDMFAPPYREPLVELGGIRMPAHLAAQISSLAQPAGDEPARQAEGNDGRGTDEPGESATEDDESLADDDEPEMIPESIRAAYDLLTEQLGREPSGQELGDVVGLSRSTANRWKRAQKAAVVG